VIYIRTAGSEADHMVVGRQEEQFGWEVVLGKTDLVENRCIVGELAAGQ